jgi:hypothetical protein
MTWHDAPVDNPVQMNPATNPAGHPVAGAYVPDLETGAKVEAIAGRLDSIVAQRKELEDEEKFLRQRLAVLCPPGSTKAGRFTVQVRENRRFDMSLAMSVLTPLELEACSTTIVSRALAQAKLSPERYAECQAVTGDPVVRVS